MQGQFGATSTTEEVLSGVDLGGKRVLVTGVSAGLGVETARVAAAHGARVVGTARDLAKARKALADFAELPIEVVECDLASLASVRRCAAARASSRSVSAGTPQMAEAHSAVLGWPSVSPRR